jgi:hypothetical protein
LDKHHKIRICVSHLKGEAREKEIDYLLRDKTALDLVFKWKMIMFRKGRLNRAT